MRSGPEHARWGAEKLRQISVAPDQRFAPPGDLRTSMGHDDHPEFEAWYRREHPRMLAALVVLVGDLAVAEDAVAEAFARAFADWDHVGAMVAPGGWTYRVAVNAAKRSLRRARLESRIWAAKATPPALPPPAAELWELVRSLAPRQRTAVILRHVLDHSEPEIASIMGVTRGTVSRSLRAAHHKLGSLLDDVVEAKEGHV
ncbi:MAG: sigma factor-like helix-turn-helix DNA-binding protein [Acidimicrobiales bacterium]